MKETKKQLIINSIINKAKILAKEPLTDKQLNTLTSFINSRLDTHGRYGYMFQVSINYKKQFLTVDNISTIAAYVLEKNFIKN